MTTKKSLKIVKALKDAGHIAYYAGGYVRDLLLGTHSTEIDIATSATPQEVQSLFLKTIPVGISFGVVIVVLEDEPFEVATFRSDGAYLDGRHPDHVDFSSPEEDAKRRDFTINGMFYDPLTNQVFDFVNGEADLEKRVIRAIGNPEERFTEDRLRMIRACRFAARFGFRIEEETEKAIEKHASTLFPSVSMERVWQEFGKMKHMDQAINLLHRFGLLQTIFPQLKDVSLEEKTKSFENFPKETPAILYLREILPDTQDLVAYIKASKQDQKLLDYFDTKCVDLYDWTQFYKNPNCALYLEIEKAKGHNIREHKERQKKLALHIARREPIVTSLMLKEVGVQPGPEMGRLLHQAERLAINENLSSAEILKQLLNS